MFITQLFRLKSVVHKTNNCYLKIVTSKSRKITFGNTLWPLNTQSVGNYFIDSRKSGSILNQMYSYIHLFRFNLFPV